MSKAPLPPIDVRDIRVAHLEQLAQLELPLPRKAPTDDVPPEVVMEHILEWIKENPASLQAARDMRGFSLFPSYSRVITYQLLAELTCSLTIECTSDSYDTPNWDTAFFTFVESITMYLRYGSGMHIYYMYNSSTRV